MKKSLGAVTETGRYRRIFAALATVLLVASLISGAEAFAPLIELDDAECTPTLDVVLVEPRALKDDNVVHVARREPVAARESTFFPIFSRPADSQVLSVPGDSGRQRAAHPTGPPAIYA